MTGRRARAQPGLRDARMRAARSSSGESGACARREAVVAVKAARPESVVSELGVS